MPRIWLDYLALLSSQHEHTKTRRAFDRALCALPVTQHDRVWELYLSYAKACPVAETAVRIHRRYLQFDADSVEEYIDFLLGIGRVSEAALKLAEVLNHEGFVSMRGKSRHKLWMELCELVRWQEVGGAWAGEGMGGRVGGGRDGRGCGALRAGAVCSQRAGEGSCLMLRVQRRDGPRAVVRGPSNGGEGEPCDRRRSTSWLHGPITRAHLPHDAALPIPRPARCSSASR